MRSVIAAAKTQIPRFIHVVNCIENDTVDA